jgi:hypothetical protein
MRLKIISNGKVMGTHVVNAETGEELENCTAVSFSIDVKSLTAKATVELVLAEAEIDALFKAVPKAMEALPENKRGREFL